MCLSDSLWSDLVSLSGLPVSLPLSCFGPFRFNVVTDMVSLSRSADYFPVVTSGFYPFLNPFLLSFGLIEYFLGFHFYFLYWFLS